ncbi:MAG: stress response translation initiation inhibitor YciH [Candidatus Woesearchaeota archaeon]|nr:stress response translation initiation inhibitor YciH [Candidatus Woesearchaeota archaeon]
MNICPVCGLPKELCVCETIAKETQRIKVCLENKKFGKNYTVISGIDEKEIDIKKLIKKLKTELACGGTVKDARIELQGDHRHKVRDVLKEFGFPESRIEVR